MADDVVDLTALGWDERLEASFEPYRRRGLVAGRVAVQHRGAWDVLTAAGERRCDVPGRAYRDRVAAELPAVGDWVAVEPRGTDRGTIHSVLPRRTKFSRKTTLETAEEQVLATNVDLVLVATSLADDLSPRRLERYLTLAHESGARPLILLTKADRDDAELARVAEVEEVARGVPAIVVSARTGVGMDTLRSELRPGVTAVLLGSSGVGKSTLVNALAGEELLATAAVRRDGKGRHTTTRRELIVLPDGALLIDTPGLRELQLWDAGEGLQEAFDDVVSLFEHCRFSDCRHAGEPGCAVQEAIDDGRLTRERWESYVKLQEELQELERRRGRGRR